MITSHLAILNLLHADLFLRVFFCLHWLEIEVAMDLKMLCDGDIKPYFHSFKCIDLSCTWVWFIFLYALSHLSLLVWSTKPIVYYAFAWFILAFSSLSYHFYICNVMVSLGCKCFNLQCKLFKEQNPVIFIDYNTYQSRLSRCRLHVLSTFSQSF